MLPHTKGKAVSIAAAILDCGFKSTGGGLI